MSYLSGRTGNAWEPSKPTINYFPSHALVVSLTITHTSLSLSLSLFIE
jgi:hypothetical protein